ncbi:MAG: twin-arginine translocation signal domain-containing protein, partial [Bradyrhizobium sp.]|uniref:twin-arginine translocation signal domain-containing protein n=1 Tax=Bradyrhizobium sp. TaxID=376 RepID=UPI001DAC69E2
MRRRAGPDNELALTSRRGFLRKGAIVGGVVLTSGLAANDARAGEADNLPPNVPEWMKTPGDPMGSQPYGTPSPFEKNV